MAGTPAEGCESKQRRSPIGADRVKPFLQLASVSGGGLLTGRDQDAGLPGVPQDEKEAFPPHDFPQEHRQFTRSAAAFYNATTYTAGPSAGSDNRLRRRSETGQAILVPAVMCGFLGPLCWVIGRQGWSFSYALWSSILVIYAVYGLRERLRRAARMEATRIASRKRILQEDETAEWLNIILFRVWQFHEPLLSANLRQDFLQKLDAVRPSRVLAFEIPLFTLGKKSPFMSSARIITKTPFSDSKVPEDRIVMHLTMGFQAPGLEIVILAKTSYGTIPIKIKDFYLQGRMRCEMDLIPKYPHIQTASFTFLETPVCEFDIQPMGVSLMEVPYLAAIVQAQIVHGINEHLLDPAKVVFNLIETQSEATSIEAADGIMLVTLLEVELPQGGRVFGSSAHPKEKNSLAASAYNVKLQVGDDVMYTKNVREEEGAPEESWGGRMRMLGAPSTTAFNSMGSGPALTSPRRPDRLSKALSRRLNLNHREIRQPRLVFGGETFAFLMGGNVGAVDTVQLTLNQKRTQTSRTICSLTVPLEEALNPRAPAGGLQVQVPLLDGQADGRGEITLGLRYMRLPEIVLEQTLPTVIHRVNERTLSPVNMDADSLGLLKDTDHPHAGSLVIILHKAEELPSVDVLGVQDCYAVVFAGEREIFRTKKSPTKTLSPEWEQSREFSTFDVRRIRLKVAIFDTGRNGGEKGAMAEADLDLCSLFTTEEAIHFGRRASRIHKRYLRLHRPSGGSKPCKGHGGLGGKDANELKHTRKAYDAGGGGQERGKSSGFVCVSLLFRPLPAQAVAPELLFHGTLESHDTYTLDRPQADPYQETAAESSKTRKTRRGKAGAWPSTSKSKTARATVRSPTGVAEDGVGSDPDEHLQGEDRPPRTSRTGISRFFQTRRCRAKTPSEKQSITGKPHPLSSTISVLFEEEGSNE